MVNIMKSGDDGVSDALGPLCLRFFLLAAAAAWLFGAAGCAADAQYERGRQLLAAGQYDQAVEAFDQASAKAPNNVRYHNALLEAKGLAADRRMARARELVAEKRLSDARQELDIALKLMPGHPEGVPLAARIGPEIEKCGGLIAQAREALARQDWASGARLMAEAYNIDKSHPQMEALRKQAEGAVVDRHLATAREALAAGKWDAAIEACAQVRRVEPNNTEAARIDRQANDRREAMRLFESARSLIAAGDMPQAFAPLQQAAGLWSDNAEIQSELNRVKGPAVDQLAARARSEAQAGRYLAAVETLDRALLIDPARDGLRQQRGQVLDDWGAGLMEEHQRDAAKGAWESAWVAAVVALAVAPEHPERARQACRTAEEGIRRRLAYNLSVLLTESDDHRANDRLAISRVLLEEITSIHPDHVRLGEQSALSKLLAEFSISSADVNNRDKLRAMAQRLPGTNVFLFVNMTIRDGASAKDGPDPNAAGAKGAAQHWLDLQMSMVDVSGGRLVWQDAETLPFPGGETGPAAASADPVAVIPTPEPIPLDAVAALRPAIRAKVAEMFRQHAEDYRRAAVAEAVVENSVRYLFDTSGMPDAQSLDSVLTTVLGPRASGDLLAACKRIATERLALAKGSATGPDASASAEPVRQPPRPSPLATPVVAAITRPAAATAPPALASRPATPAAVVLPKPPVGASRPAEPQPPGTAAAAPSAATRPASPVQVFQGIVSRDDDRYPKEVLTVDGIVVKVRDTDKDPLDADLEIRVGKARKEYNDKRVGARIGGYGESGRPYVIVITRIDDETETVHFSVETVENGPK